MIKLIIGEGSPVDDESILIESTSHNSSHNTIKPLINIGVPMNGVSLKIYKTNYFCLTV